MYIVDFTALMATHRESKVRIGQAIGSGLGVSFFGDMRPKGLRIEDLSTGSESKRTSFVGSTGRRISAKHWE